MNFDAIPIAVIFAGTVIIVVAAIELGDRLGLAMHRRSHDDKDSSISTISGAILGLAAFMLAFTFAIVSDRYDARKGSGSRRRHRASHCLATLRTSFRWKSAARRRRCCGNTSIYA